MLTAAFRHVAILMPLLGLALGCGDRPDIPPTAEVTGMVTYNGDPLPNAEVQFVPNQAKGTKGPPAIGYTDASGRYELTTASTVKGAIVGHHQVRVSARAQPKDETDTLPPLLIPEHYTDPSTSGLTAEVLADQANPIDLELKSEP